MNGKHGKPSTYKAGCRCTKCRDAHRINQNAANARRKADPALADIAGHGKRSTYTNYGCRCTACATASSTAQREYRARQKERAQ